MWGGPRRAKKRFEAGRDKRRQGVQGGPRRADAGCWQGPGRGEQMHGADRAEASECRMQCGPRSAEAGCGAD